MSDETVSEDEQLQYRNPALIGIFKGLDQGTLEAIGALCVWRTFAADEIIVSRYDESTTVHFLTRGGVRVVNYSRSGQEITLKEYYAGDMFGELSALDGHARSANVIALEAVTVGVMTARDLSHLLDTNLQVSKRMITHLCEVVRSTSERVMELATMSANARVVAEILHLADQQIKLHGEEDDLEQITIDNLPTQLQIAHRIGTTRETVSRVFSMLIKDKIVAKSGEALTIYSYDALIDVLDEIENK